MQEKTRKKAERERIIFLLFCTVVPVANFIIFYLGANFSSIKMAFTDLNGALTLEHFVRLYKEVINGTQFMEAVKNTMITFLILVAVFPFKVLVSYFIYKKIPGAGFYRVAFFLPMIVFSVCVSLVFTNLIGPSGFIAQWIGDVIGLEKVPELLSDSRFAKWTIWAHMLWLGFPGDLIIWGGTFARIPTDVLESAQVDGVTWWTEFTKIIVPMVWPTVALQMVLLTCSIFGSSGQVWLLTRGEFGTHTIDSWMYMQLLNGSGGSYKSGVFNYMSAAGLVLTTIAVILSITVRRWTDKAFEEVEF